MDTEICRCQGQLHKFKINCLSCGFVACNSVQRETCPYCQTNFDFKPVINVASSISNRDAEAELNRAKSLREKLLAVDKDILNTDVSENEPYRIEKATSLSDFLFNF